MYFQVNKNRGLLEQGKATGKSSSLLQSKAMEKINGSAVNVTSPAAPISEAERNLKVVLYCGLGLIGTVGNFLVIFVVKGKSRRSINDVFILNLAASDLAFLWLSLPFYTYELFAPFRKTLFYCKIIWPMMSVVLSASVFTLVSMATERSRGILHPLKPRIELRTTLLWVLVIWLSSLVTILPLMVVAEPVGTACTEGWPADSYRKLYTVVLFAVQYAVPSLVIAGAYVRIAVSLVRSRRPVRTAASAGGGQLLRLKTRAENLQVGTDTQSSSRGVPLTVSSFYSSSTILNRPHYHRPSVDCR